MLFLFWLYVRVGGEGNECFFKRRSESGGMIIERIIGKLTISSRCVYYE